MLNQHPAGDVDRGPDWTGDIRFHAACLVTLGCMIACWYFATPWPQLELREQPDLWLASRWVAISFGVLCLLPLVFSKFATDLTLADFGFRIGNGKLGMIILLAAAVPVLIGVFLGGADRRMIETYPWPGPEVANRWSTLIFWFCIYLFYYVAFEFFFRGFVLRIFERHAGIITAIWIQTMGSVLLHLGKPPIEVLASIPAGFAFAWIAIKTRSLIYPIVLHFYIGVVNDLGVLYHSSS